MTKPIDWMKPVVDQNGNPWRVLCTDRKNENHPVIAMEENGDFVASFDVFGNGLHIPQKGIAPILRNAPVKREGWVNVYPVSADGCRLINFHKTKSDADRRADRSRLACIRIEWEE